MQLSHFLESLAVLHCIKPSLGYIWAAFGSTCVVVICQGNTLAAVGDILFYTIASAVEAYSSAHK